MDKMVFAGGVFAWDQTNILSWATIARFPKTVGTGPMAESSTQIRSLAEWFGTCNESASDATPNWANRINRVDQYVDLQDDKRLPMADEKTRQQSEEAKTKQGFVKAAKKKKPSPKKKAEKDKSPEKKETKPVIKQPSHPKDVFREIVETVVFVVVLVLLLKTFVAEAFIIPTGSMAPTLLGFNQPVTCPECNYHFTVNRSSEVAKNPRERGALLGYICPNCRKQLWTNKNRR